MRKLTDRQILQLHAMAREGIEPATISRELRLHRNSVTAHLHGDVTYPTSIMHRLTIAAPLVAQQWLDRRQAAPWIPGHPSPAKMRKLMSTGELRSKLHNGARVTSMNWISDYCSRYKSGIWLRLSMFTSQTQLPPPYEHAVQIDPKITAFALCTAYQLARDCDRELELPAWMVHRATQQLDRVGVAVL